jgi:3-phosphoshikimate 1-carboxyvinyltransferase
MPDVQIWSSPRIGLKILLGESVKRLVRPGRVNGRLIAPSSKSMAQRAIAIASLAAGESEVLLSSSCDDIEAALGLAAGLGSIVRPVEGGFSIRGGENPPRRELHCGESGLSIRMFSCLAALHGFPIVMRAGGSLARRPMGMIADALGQLGAEVESSDGYPPLKITGPLQAAEILIDGSLSSQLLTGLLIALPVVKGRSIINVSSLKSKPYVEMTVELVRSFGGEIEHDSSLSRFSIIGGSSYTPQHYRVEGDWSGASCLLVAGATSGGVEIANLRHNSLQADRNILNCLKMAGAEVKETSDGVSVRHQSLKGIEADLSECPDLFPALVALCVSCDGVSTLGGADRLQHKESDRASALIEEFRKLGAEIYRDGNSLLIRGGGQLLGGEVFSHHDHRIAMALAVAGLKAMGSVEINSAECISKSYPDFFEDLEQIRAL